MKQKKIISCTVFCFLLACIVLFASCRSTPKTLYSWYDYPSYSYKYVKNTDDKSREELLEVYEKIISSQNGIRVGAIPPGMCADYGYLCLLIGETEKGIELLKKEIELYPESEKIVQRILKAVKE